MSKILITGGSGYIGRNLRRLLADHSISAPSHSELDLLDRDKLDEYLRYGQFDAVIHAAGKGAIKGTTETWEDIYVPNILMYENLDGCLGWQGTPLIIFGSGAEFDRRSPVRDEYASSILFNFPIDPYGLSKNIIARRAITYGKNTWILRLFGCFNYDEDGTRFIKNCITSIKLNCPIIINQDKKMDFFFMDDIVPVIERIFADINNKHWPEEMKLPKNINLTYVQKYTLLEIAKIVAFEMKKPDHTIIIAKDGMGMEYTGSGDFLFRNGIPLIGLHRGIRRTISELT